MILQATWIVSPEIQSGQLVDLFPDYKATAASFEDPAMWILYPSRTYVPEMVRMFVLFLKKHVTS